MGFHTTLLLIVSSGAMAQSNLHAGGTLPPLFFANVPGSANPAIQYVARGAQWHAVFSSEGVVLQANGQLTRVRWLGANRNTRIQGLHAMRARVNFLLGRDSRQWRTDIPSFEGVLYSDLYPGIDLTYTGAGEWIKSEFLVRPGASPDDIRMEYSGSASIDNAGDLRVGDLKEAAPEVYQDGPSGRVKIAGRYRLLGPHTVGFDIGEYDESRPLIIDPVISYSTYLGGTGLGAVTGAAVDSGGNLYVTGWTEALNFPIIGAVQAANQGGVDAFVAKFNPTGTALLYATYIGGSGEDKGAAIAVDATGQAHVTGSTASLNFPLASPIRSTRGGPKTAFVLKLNAVGNTLLYSTYMGGTAYEVGTAIALDASGNMYVAGDTQSVNFPVQGAAQSTNAGGFDAFVTKLTPAGAISYSTYLGGSANEHAGGIAVDSSGRAYVAGGTYSTNFPVVTPVQNTSGGNQDAFLTRLSAAGSSISYSTYVGGNGAFTAEQANAVAVDSSGNAYAAGVTNSSNFPVTAGAYQTLYNSTQDAFVVKVNSSGSAWVYGTFLGGTAFDWATGIAVDSSGNAYVAGYTSSGDFAQANPAQSAFGGMYDAFTTKLNSTGNGLLFSTYFGGSGSDTANTIVIDADGNMFVGGQTSSLDLPLQGPVQSSNNGGSIGWTARLGVTPPPSQTPSTVSVAPASGNGNPASFTAQYSDTGGAAALTTVSLLVNTSAAVDYACYVTYTPSTNQFALYNDVASSGALSLTPGSGSQQNGQCTLSGAGSSVNLSGSTLTMTVALSFDSAFTGSKSVYLAATDAGASTGWVALGTWTIPSPPPLPSADSVSPSAGSGATQTFNFVYSDTQSASNLLAVAVLITPGSSSSDACYVVYDRVAGTVSLRSDNALSSSSKALGSSATLQNSQCVVGATSSSLSGLTLTFTATIAFKPAFNGVQNIYMYASESASNTGWVLRGSFTVLAGGTPVANSVVPGSGSGPGQRFSFTTSDASGSTYLTQLVVLFAPTLDNANACNLLYDRITNRVSLTYDIPANGSASLTPGANTVITNAQCSLRGANTTVVYTATSMIVTLDLVFNAAYFGAKNVYLYAAEAGANSGWVAVGSWTVTGGAPTADSVSPASGSGSNTNFTFTVSDSVSEQNIIGMSMLFTPGAPTNLANGCYLLYTRSPATIGLYNDAGTTLSTKPQGSSANLQNSQCAVGFTVRTTSGNSMALTIQVVFKAAFAGAKTVYLQANEPNTNSGWVQRGTWTVP